MMMFIIHVLLILIVNWCSFSFANESNSTTNTTPISHQNNSLGREIYKFKHCDPIEWLCFNTSEKYNCCRVHGITCLESGPVLKFWYCATYSEDNLTKSLSITKCPYYLLRKDYRVTTLKNRLHIFSLPVNLKELNKYICDPLNRKGPICSECKDGFGYSVSSFGHKCANCTNTWYNISLYIVAKFLPTTALYIVILLFRLSAVAPPMPCFIMYAQLIVFWIKLTTQDSVLAYSLESSVGYTVNGTKLKVLDIFYCMFNQMDQIIFKYLLPPLCLSTKLKQFHVFLLGYISVFYPILLIFVTWVCVTLHDRNFKPFVSFWRPFHKCFARLRRKWDIKSDLVDVFITFFLLSYAKCSYMVVELLTSGIVRNVDQWGNVSYRHHASIDTSLDYMGHTHLSMLIMASLLYIAFDIIPLLYLTLYPFGIFRRCLSKLRLDFITINTFADKIQCCYKNGLDGGRDLRSLSGMYFFSMSVVFLMATFIQLLQTGSTIARRWFSMGFSSLIMSLIVTITKPYQKMYMNHTDTLLLSTLAVHYFAMTTELYNTAITLLFIPMCILVAVMVIKLNVFSKSAKKLYLRINALVQWLLIFCPMKHNLFRREHDPTHVHNTEAASPVDSQPLIQPMSSEINYGI